MKKIGRKHNTLVYDNEVGLGTVGRSSSAGVRQPSVGDVRVSVRGERGVRGVRGEGMLSQVLEPLGGGGGMVTPERWQQPSASDIQASSSFSRSQSGVEEQRVEREAANGRRRASWRRTVSPEQGLGREQRHLQHVGRLHYQHVFEPPQVLELQALKGLQGHRGEQVRGRSLKATSWQGHTGVTLSHQVASAIGRPHEAL